MLLSTISLPVPKGPEDLFHLRQILAVDHYLIETISIFLGTLHQLYLRFEASSEVNHGY